MKTIRNGWSLFGLKFLVMLGLLWAVPLRAADNTWTNGSGNWEVGANWLSGAPNSSQSFLYITNDVTKTVQLLNIGPADVGTLAISNLVIGGASGTTNTVLVDAGLAANFQILKSLTINSGGAFVQNASTTTVTGASFFDGITVEGGSLAVGGGLLDASTSLLVLGSHVGGSQLVVTNGTLLNGTVYLGWWSGSSNNTALISGPAAIWRNDSLNVGLEGGGNRLTISNGGKAFTQSLIEGNGNGSGNTVEITGANSALISDYDVQVGYYSGNNRMTISAGGMVSNRDGYVGTAGGANNAAVVTGAGSVWQNTRSLTLGGWPWGGWSDGGTASSLTVESNAWVLVGAMGTNDLPNLSGAGGLVIGDALGGTPTLIIGHGSRVNSGVAYIGYAADAGATLVTGNGSVWSNSDSLYIGYNGAGNQLTISNGGWVVNKDGAIGRSYWSINNAVIITGPGSTWSNCNSLDVGYVGSGNTLTITNHGTVFATYGSIGFATGSSNNAVIITGLGSTWNNSSDLYAGFSGIGNSLSIANGGAVYNGYGVIGCDCSASNNSVTVTDAGSVWNNRVDLKIGYYGSGNRLMIANGGAVYNDYGYIGYDAIASNNSVTVTGSGSAWNNRDDLYVGRYGYGNSLTIANRGRVINGTGNIGTGASSASSNSVLVTGNGSVWQNNGDLLLGAYRTTESTGYPYYIPYDVWHAAGVGNRLTVESNGWVLVGAVATNALPSLPGSGGMVIGDASSGGTLLSIRNGSRVTSGYSYIGYSANEVGAVDVDNSVWSNSNALCIGLYGASSRLNIANGGQVFSPFGSVGVRSSSSNNAVSVSDAGSIWNNSGLLYVGDSGSGNQLSLFAGSTVLVGGTLTISASTGSSNNAVNMYGGQLIVTNAAINVGPAGYGQLNIYDGTVLAKQLLATNGAKSVINLNGGTLVSQGTTVSNGQDFIIGNTRGNATFIALGGTHAFQNDLYVGNYSSGNQLIITNSGTVFNSTGIIGLNAGANNNAVMVTGAGSTWNNSGDLYVGSNGVGNSLTISNSGTVSNGFCIMGFNASASNNAVTVSGSGSIWNSSALHIGYQGSGNSLTISNSGTVFNSLIGIIGNQIGANNNAVTVTGTGSTWNNGDDLYVGGEGSGNSLTIANSGTVFNSRGTIGSYVRANNNAVTVTGAGSVWSNRYHLTIGNTGFGNRLTISNSGTVFNSLIGIIGYGSGASNNTVIVTGTGSTWINGSDLFIGTQDIGNSLTLANGGAVTVGGTLTISSFAGASNNAVNMFGGQMTVTNGAINIGPGGSGQLNLSGGTVLVQQLLATNGANSVINFNGGTLVSQGTTISNGPTFLIGNSSGNATFIALGGTHTFQNGLCVGNSSSGNRLLITNAATVYNGYGLIGSYADNNAVIVTGAGSVWSNRFTLYVGDYGSGNSLTISNGANLYSYYGFIGDQAAANNNAVTITGPGSVWSNSSDLYIGNSGSGNRLTLADSGTVSARNIYLAYNPGAGGTLWLDGGTVAASNVNVAAGGTLIYDDGTFHLSGALTLAGGQLQLGTTLAVGAGVGGSTVPLVLSSGSVLIEPTGVLRLGTDITTLGVAITNQGVLQTLATSVAFNGGLNNQSYLSLNAGQSVTVQNGLDNSGGLVLQPGAVLSADAIVNQSGSIYLPNPSQLSSGTAWTNAGPISIAGGGITGAKLNNSDLIEGYGSISAQLNNLAGGTLRASGGLLALNGSSIQNQSGAALEIESGATLRLSKSLGNSGVVNNLGGILSMASSVLTNNGVITGYGSFKPQSTINNGQALFQGGQSDIYGTYLNAATTTVSHATANFFGAVTNQSGALFKNTGGVVTYFGTVYNNGTILSDPATNIYTTTLTLGPSGVLEGGVGDRFVFQADLVSSNPVGLKLQNSTVAFTDGAHLLDLSGVTAFGTLNLSSGASLTLDGADLQVGLFGATTNQLTTAWTIFYDPVQNPTLESKTYSLSGGGFLQSIPEPGTIALVALMGLGFYYGRRVSRWHS